MIQAKATYGGLRPRMGKGSRPRLILIGSLLAAFALLNEAAPPTHAMPLSPEAVPPAQVAWFNTYLPGGPMWDVSVAPVAKGRQKIFAAGNLVFIGDQGSAWSRTRPETGRAINVLAAGNGTAFVSSSNGGNWRTTTYGRNWDRMTVRSIDPVKFAAASPNFPLDSQVYAITLGDFRLYKSGSGGTTWAAVEIEPNATKRLEVGAIAYSPLHAFDEVQFAGTDNGIYKSTSAGQNWERVAGPENGAPAFGSTAGPLFAQGLIISPEYGDDKKRALDPDDKTLFAYNQKGVYRSDDDGKTWRRLPLDVEEVRDLAVSNGWPGDPVLLAAVKAPGNVGARSTDGGATWTRIPGRDGVAGTGVAMAVDFAPIEPPDPIYLSRIYLPLGLKRVALGEITRPVDKYIGSREAYLATDGDGMLRTTDAGLSWTNESLTLTSAQPGPLAFLPGGANAAVLAGTESSGLFRSPDGGRTWRWLDSGLPRGDGQDVTALRVSPDFATDRTVYLGATSGVWISRDAGATWTKTSAPAGMKHLMLSPSFSQDRTILATGNLSTDGGATWSPLGDAGGPWAGAAFSPRFATDRTLWVSLAGKPANYNVSMLRRSTNAGQSWETVSYNALNGHPLGPVNAFQMEADPVKLFVGADTGLLTSEDDGKTWSRVGLNGLSQTVSEITILPVRDPISAVLVAVGVDGIMWSTNRGISWTREAVQVRAATNGAIASDGSALLVSVPAAVARYGTGSARIGLPSTSR